MFESFNEYLWSVFTIDDLGNVPTPWNKFRDRQDDELTDINITQEKVMGKLLKLKADKATGVDKLNSGFLRELHSEICSPQKNILHEVDPGRVNSGGLEIRISMLNFEKVKKK